jgi:restriction endonuclease S subunit
VQPGFSIKKALVHEQNGTHQIITAKNLTEGEPYTYYKDHALRITPSRPAEKYLLNPGDILFMSRGAKNIATQLESFPQPALAPSTFYILRPEKNIFAPYLVWILNQKPIQAEITGIRTGAGTPMVPRKEFGDIYIPLPSFEMQQKIIELDNIMRKEQSLLMRLADKRKDLITAACLQAINK